MLPRQLPSFFGSPIFNRPGVQWVLVVALSALAALALSYYDYGKGYNHAPLIVKVNGLSSEQVRHVRVVAANPSNTPIAMDPVGADMWALAGQPISSVWLEGTPQELSRIRSVDYAYDAGSMLRPERWEWRGAQMQDGPTADEDTARLGLTLRPAGRSRATTNHGVLTYRGDLRVGLKMIAIFALFTLMGGLLFYAHRKPGRDPAARLSTRRTLALAAALTGVAFAAASMFIAPAYGGPDELTLASLAGGYFGSEMTPFLLFSNIVIGRALNAAYAVWPTLPWYGIHLYIALAFMAWGVALAFGAITRNIVWWIVPFSLFFSVYLLPVLGAVQFTTVAGVMTMIGWVLFIVQTWPGRFSSDRSNLAVGVTAGLLLVWGGAIRFDTLILASAVCGPVFLGAYWLNHGRFPPPAADRLRLALVGAALLLAAGLHLYDVGAYRGDAGWNEWREYHNVSGSISDYQLLSEIDAEELDARLGAVGWSRNDAALVAHRFFLSPTLMDARDVAVIRGDESLATRVFEIERWNAGFSHALASWTGAGTPSLILLTACFILLVGMRQWHHALFVAVMFAAAVFALALIHVVLKPPPFRVFFPLVAGTGTLALLFVVMRARGLNPFIGTALSRYILLWVCLGLLVASWINHTGRGASREFHASFFRAEMRWLEREGGTYYNWGAALPYEWASFPGGERVLREGPEDMIRGTYVSMTPTIRARIAEFGWPDPALALATDSTVRVILPHLKGDPEFADLHTKHIRQYRMYLSEHYGLEDVRFEIDRLNSRWMTGRFTRTSGEQTPPGRTSGG